jgi:N-acetyl-gamma-glutamyl-phosphate reductase
MGATGYAGGELLRLCAFHPDLNVLVATGASSAGRAITERVPSLAGAYPDLVVQPSTAVFDANLDVVFLCLPHGESQEFVPSLLERDVQVVDLGADYRLRDPGQYPTWYDHAHTSAHLLGEAVYGLVERHREELKGARLIAVPGCYPTAAALALGPFADANVIERDNLVIDALSGVSGAGRALSERLQFSRLAANAEAYGLLTHRHTPEIEQEIGATVVFTPHLVPVARGMLVTAYARVSAHLSSDDALAMLREAYALDPCVVVVDDPPTLKDPLGSNLCFVSARVDERTGWLIAMSSIDNLTKGAAGQAIQAWNVATGREETLGLPLAGVSP